MMLWLGMSSYTLPGETSIPDDEPPGSDNIRKKNKNVNIGKKPSRSKKPKSPKKPSANKKPSRSKKKKLPKKPSKK